MSAFCALSAFCAFVDAIVEKLLELGYVLPHGHIAE
jgi:hypothetical protein